MTSKSAGDRPATACKTSPRISIHATQTPEMIHNNRSPLTIDLALALYRQMLLIRRFELTAQKVYKAGEMPGFIHLYIGEEAIATGVCASSQR